jgi:hypothetical protein
MAYPFGQAVRLTTGTITSNGTPANPATLALTITLPDTSTVVFNLAAFTNDSTGVYHYDYLPTLPGVYDWRIVATGPNTAAEGTFAVDAVGAHYADPVSLDYVKAHLNINGVSINDAELQLVTSSAVVLIEDLTGPIRQITVVDTFNGGSTQIVLRTQPVISVVSVTERLAQTTYTDLADSAGTYNNYGYQLDSGGLITKHLSSFAAPFFPGIRNVTVTYIAGRTVLSDKLQLAVAEQVRHLWQTQQGSRSRQDQPGDRAPGQAYAIPNRVKELIGIDNKLPGIG